MDKQILLLQKMMDYESGCPQRVHHFLKVLSFAEIIGSMEELDEKNMEILRIAAIVHDIGILPSLEKYGSSAGAYQQIEGPPVARQMLASLGYATNIIDRVCNLVAHHHTYNDITGIDYQILVEADLLVNILEDGFSANAAKKVYKTIFQTKSGKKIYNNLYGNLLQT